MKKSRLAVLADCFGLITSGCAPPPWQAKLHTDEFSDTSFCRVASKQGFRSGFQEGLLLSVSKLITHEFCAEMRPDGPRIGVWGRFGMVLDDVQMRVDNNPTVNITVQDTPIDYAPAGLEVTQINLPNATEEQQRAYEESLKQASQATTQATLSISPPYKVATGAKAKTLLEQIKVGEQVKFRILGAKKVIATTARIEITDQFKDALRKCGII